MIHSEITDRIIKMTGAMITFAAAKGVADLLRRAKEINPIVQGFDKLSKSINSTAESMKGALRIATRGLISDFNLMKTTNNAITLGVAKSEEQFARLAAGAVTLGRSLGIDATRAIDNLTVALGRGSILILDNSPLFIISKRVSDQFNENSTLITGIG